MIGYIYSTDTNEIICEIHGVDNDDVESKANEMGYMGCDEYGLTYTRGQMAFETGHDYQVTAAHEAAHG
jgi:hypothetical protein